MESKKPDLKVKFSSHSAIVESVCFSPDQTKLCSGGDDEKVILTNLQNNQTEKVFTGHKGSILGSDFSYNGEFLVTGSEDNTIRIWKASMSEIGNTTKLEGHDDEVNCVLFLRKDQNRVISCSDDETIKIWNVERKKENSTLLGCECYVYSVDILPDNRTIVSGDHYHNVRFWDLRSGECVQTLDHPRKRYNYVNSVQFHPNSFSLASGSADTTIKIFDFRTFKLLQNYQEHSDAVTSVCFHPSGKYLLSGSYDKTIKVFDLFEKKILFTMKDHSGKVECVKFSPDGKFFASASYDMKVILWDFPLGRMLFRDDKDIDEEERVNYLIEKDLVLDSDGIDDCSYERNILKIKIDHFCTLYCHKFLFY